MYHDKIMNKWLCLATALTLAGCAGVQGGGAFAPSDAVVEFDQTPGFDMIITRDNTTLPGSTNICSATVRSWCGYAQLSTREDFTFTLDHGQTPYRIYLRNNGTTRRSATFRVYIAGTLRLNKTVDVDPGTTFEASVIS
jgi:hypothetical protein